LEQEDPQWYLENATLNPIAPFTGGVAKWEAIVYDDGTTYEGLAREGLYGDKIPHGKGTYIMGASGRLPWEPPVMDEDGNIITDPSRGDVRGDKYEGELWGGKPHGLGTYTKLDGTVYRGEFRDGEKSGCGMEVRWGQYMKALEEGTSEEEARKQLMSSRRLITMGKYKNNRLMNNAIPAADMPQGKKMVEAGTIGDLGMCSVEEVRGTVEEVNSVTLRTRMFQFKPEGDVLNMFHSASKTGVPATMLNDPIYYPPGTEFMKPGPAGQLGAVPENKGFKKEMVKAAANWKRIHDLYNFEYKPTPGSIEAEAREFAKKQKTEIDLEGALYEHFLKGIRTGIIKPNKVSFEDFVAMYEAKQRRKKAEDSLEMPGAGTELDLNELDDDDDSDDEEDFDEDEEEDEIKVESGGKRQGKKSPFGSLSMGISHGQRALSQAFGTWSRRAMPKASFGQFARKFQSFVRPDSDKRAPFAALSLSCSLPCPRQS